MRTEIGLTLEQTQKLVMTPELRQAITVLQLSALELQQYLQKELLENPFLEFKEEIEELEEKNNPNDNLEKDNMDRSDIDWQEYFSDRSDPDYLGMPKEKYTEQAYENFLSKEPGLQEHLQLQLDLAISDGTELKIGQFLLGCLDDYGYLTVDLAEIAQELHCSIEDVERVLKIIQLFEPAGVGARDLKECLLIQLRQEGRLDKTLEKVIMNHLEDLAHGKINRIAAELKISRKKAQNIADIIRSLNPKPGYQFNQINEVRYIIPDVLVERVNDNLVVLLNDSAVPRLGINNHYYSLLKDNLEEKPEKDLQAKKFLENKLNSALWLIRSVEQRRLTLYRVACCIVDWQREFLLKGVKYLRPLNLRQVADTIGVHESTVSRATANKYIQTPQGIFNFKFLLSGGVSDSRGISFSTQSIKKWIKEIIEAEDKQVPFSDQEIADKLAQKGVPISRRTVAKYRAEMGILSKARRRRY